MITVKHVDTTIRSLGRGVVYTQQNIIGRMPVRIVICSAPLKEHCFATLLQMLTLVKYDDQHDVLSIPVYKMKTEPNLISFGQDAWELESNFILDRNRLVILYKRALKNRKFD